MNNLSIILPDMAERIDRRIDRLATIHDFTPSEAFRDRLKDFYFELDADALLAHSLLKTDDSFLKDYRDRLQHLRHLKRILMAGAEYIRFDLMGYRVDDAKGIAVVGVEAFCRMNGRPESERWDTSKYVWQWLTTKLGFDDIGNIRTTVRNDDPEFSHLTAIILTELDRWTKDDHRAREMMDLKSFAERCKGLDSYLLTELQVAGQTERARIILDLFGFNYTHRYKNVEELFIDPKEFAKMIKSPDNQG